MGASKVLGILSICLSIIPFVSLILGIIGLSIDYEKGEESRDIALNIVGIGLSLIFLLFTILIL